MKRKTSLQVGVKYTKPDKIVKHTSGSPTISIRADRTEKLFTATARREVTKVQPTADKEIRVIQVGPLRWNNRTGGLICFLNETMPESPADEVNVRKGDKIKWQELPPLCG
jgi:hypothetical protein